MLNSVIQHVDSILNGSTPPKPELAQMLLQTLGAISLPSQTADKEKFEEEFEAHLAVRDLSTLTLRAQAGKTDFLVCAASRRNITGHPHAVIPVQLGQVPDGVELAIGLDPRPGHATGVRRVMRRREAIGLVLVCFNKVKSEHCSVRLRQSII